MSRLNTWKTMIFLCIFCALPPVASHAQTFTDLLNFNQADGGVPFGGVVQGIDGSFYGTTSTNGAHGSGTVFKILSSGKLTTLHSFCAQKKCPDGTYPIAGLVQATDGELYGTTEGGGTNNSGTVFQITAAGQLTTLYSFCSKSGCADGVYPYARLVQATDGNFYGTTTYGGGIAGTNCSVLGCGTVFQITAAGQLTTLYRFCSQANCTDGFFPEAGLVQGIDGNLYGTTRAGGANNAGTVFQITAAGQLTTLYSFCFRTGCTDGFYPEAGLVRGANGNFYGTTEAGGDNAAGTVFEITTAGQLTTLYSFCSRTDCTDGENPVADLVKATDGNFYGTTSLDGVNFAGTIFEITPAGQLTTLYTFCSQTGCTDGAIPRAGLIQATDGKFYGTTSVGGAGKGHTMAGSIFSLDVGLGPFVKTLPASGTVGTPVKILGNQLQGATGVTFNSTPATFNVIGATEITTTVPSGATTGGVTVTTPSGTLSSNGIFHRGRRS
ncbi:MAG TPA: choice-of-anchor tandem repeat GloVer-containing protein [Ktedonobacteraceae bacterium]